MAPPPVNPPPPGHRPQWERLFGLATGATFRSPTSGAKLIIVSGLTGTGKSTIARAFALHLGAEVIQSDAIRRRLFGEPAPSTDQDSRYTPTRKEKVYEVALTEAAGILARGGWVVLDATFSTIRSRASALALARKFGVNAHLIVCELEEKETLKRLSERAFNRGSLSDAGPAEYETLKRSYEPPTSDEGLPLVRIDTKRPIPEQIALISRWILAEGYTDRRAYRSIELE